MKNPQDLCRIEYIIYRRQMHQIHRLAWNTNQRPSEFLRSVLDHALVTQEGRENHDE